MAKLPQIQAGGGTCGELYILRNFILRFGRLGLIAALAAAFPGPSLAQAAKAAAAAPIARSDKPSRTKPLWELGAIAGLGWLADYPAAAQNHLQGVALPYFVYRGKVLRAGDKGIVRGRLFQSERVEFDISLSGSFPASSADNDARRGMRDLDWLGEVGPRLQITLARAARDAKVELELPLRAVFSTDFSRLDHEGYVFAPALAYQNDRFGGRDIRLKLSLTAKFGSRDIADYFYGVPAASATATRSAFAAKAGYIGSRLQLGFVETMSSRWKMFAGLAADFHHGAANDQSPLFRNKTNIGFGAGIIWSFWQSQRRVRDDD
jgi:outer membrane scaffolding protein for murein synthesis (MipA/OmpV family)